MGCRSSRIAQYSFTINEKKPGQGHQAAKDFKTLGLLDEVVDQFFCLFCDIDRDGSGQVDLDEFYRYFDLERSPFSDRVFAVMDDNRNGEVDFREFVLTVWGFCSLDTRALSDFAFHLFDLDSSGMLNQQEVRELVAEVYGDLFETNRRIQKLLREVDKSTFGRLTELEFRDLNRKHPVLLFPAFRMQQELRRKILGESFWQNQLKERMRRGVSMVTSIWQVMDRMDAAARCKANQLGGPAEEKKSKPSEWMPGKGNLPGKTEAPRASGSGRPGRRSSAASSTSAAGAPAGGGAGKRGR